MIVYLLKKAYLFFFFRNVTAFNDSWHFLLPACGLVPWRHVLTMKPCGGQTLLRVDWQWKKKTTLVKANYTPLHASAYTCNSGVLVCAYMIKDLNIEGTSGCNCHHQYRIRARIMFERSVLNIQPTPSAIFSRMPKCGSECFLLCVHVWVCLLPQSSIFKIMYSLAPSMGRKC